MASPTPTEAFHEWVACMVAGDMAGWAARATEGLTYTHTTALCETRDEVVAAFEAGRRYTALTTEGVSEHVYDGAAVVTGIGHATIEVAGELDMRFTATLVRQDDDWRVAAWQSTRLPA